MKGSHIKKFCLNLLSCEWNFDKVLFNIGFLINSNLDSCLTSQKFVIDKNLGNFKFASGTKKYIYFISNAIL